MSEIRRSSDGVELGPRVPDGRSYDERQLGARPVPRIYYDDGAIVIYHGDCRDVLPSLGMVDHVITDPPYSEHVHSKSRRGLTVTHKGGAKDEISERRELGFESMSDSLRAVVATWFAKNTRRWVAVFSDTESDYLWRQALEAGGDCEYLRTAFWHKLGGAPQFTGDRPAVACEAITLAHRPGRKKWNGGGKAGWYAVPTAIDRRHDGNEARVHTTQKPEPLMAALVADFTDPGDVILDPFGGSGTTGVAAKRLGRKAILIEREEKYCAVAARRLSQGALNLEFVS